MAEHTTAASTPMPKFLVTTIAPENQVAKDWLKANPGGVYEGAYEFDRKSEQSSGGEQPVFLMGVTYEGESSIAAEDKGEGKFEGEAVSHAVFTEALAKTGQDLVFYIHGLGKQPKATVEDVHTMQENMKNFVKQGGDALVPPLVVPVDWACADEIAYHVDQASAELAGRALGNFLRGVKQSGIIKTTLNVVAHSMGNRVLRYVGKSAVSDDSSWYTDALQDGVSLHESAPEDLKRDENLFDNLFFVAADIPDTVFEEPDGEEHREQQEHALKSGVAALAVMTKHMHVLHADTDNMLRGSKLVNGWSRRLGIYGPKSVWEKIGNTLEKTESIDGSVNDKNVHVLDCSGWNHNVPSKVGKVTGHGYFATPESVAYYLKHMPKRRM